MAKSKATINGHPVMVDDAAPTVPLTDVTGDGGDVAVYAATAVACNGLHAGASDPATWVDPSDGYMKWFLASASGTYQGNAVAAGDVVLAVNVGATVKVWVFDWSAA